jgi:hypothetical protein
MVEYFAREGLDPKNYIAAIYVNDPDQTSVPIIVGLDRGEKVEVPADAKITVVIVRRDH